MIKVWIFILLIRIRVGSHDKGSKGVIMPDRQDKKTTQPRPKVVGINGRKQSTTGFASRSSDLTGGIHNNNGGRKYENEVDHKDGGPGRPNAECRKSWR